MDLLPGLLEVVGDLLERIRRSVEPGDELCAARLRPEQVVEPEAEVLGEVPNRGVSLVDQLATVLGDLPVGERAAQRPAAAADAVGRVVDVGRDPGLLQAICASQAGQSGADDDDAGCHGSASNGCQAPERRQAQRADARSAQQRSTGRRAGGLAGDLADRVMDQLCEWRSHPSPLGRCSLTAEDDRSGRSVRPDATRNPVSRGRTVKGLVGRPGGGSAAL